MSAETNKKLLDLGRHAAKLEEEAHAAKQAVLAATPWMRLVTEPTPAAASQSVRAPQSRPSPVVILTIVRTQLL